MKTLCQMNDLTSNAISSGINEFNGFFRFHQLPDLFFGRYDFDHF